MKRNFMISAAVCLAFLQITLPATGYAHSKPHPLTAISSMLKDSRSPSAQLLPRAMRDFNQRYGETNIAQWSINAEGAFAEYTKGGIKCRVYYNARGCWNGQLKAYTDENLDINLHKMVKQAYYDYTIKWVYEAESPASEGIPTYLFVIEDRKTSKLIRLYDQQIELMNDYDKQEP